MSDKLPIEVLLLARKLGEDRRAGDHAGAGGGKRGLHRPTPHHVSQAEAFQRRFICALAREQGDVRLDHQCHALVARGTVQSIIHIGLTRGLREDRHGELELALGVGVLARQSQPDGHHAAHERRVDMGIAEQVLLTAQQTLRSGKAGRELSVANSVAIWFVLSSRFSRRDAGQLAVALSSSR